LRNGIWHARVTVGKGKEAHREWFTLGTADRTLAERKLARLQSEIEAGRRIDSCTTSEGVASERVDDYVQVYLERRKARGVVMVKDERGYYEREIKARIGGMLLCDVRPMHVAAILEDALARGLKRESLRHIRSLLSRIFKAAWRDELIEANPVDRVEVPKVREIVKQRTILTDDEFARFMAADIDLEIRMMGLVARVLGGMRTSDIVAWDWSMIDRVHFAEAFIPRSKTGAPDRLEVPEAVRPFLRLRWEQYGCPEAGPVFPVEIGRRAGEPRKQRAQSFAKRLRRNLFKAGIVRAKPVLAPYVAPGTRTDLGFKSKQAMRLVPNPADPLYHETATTLPVDFHSFRRAFSTALAEAGVNVQQAMRLAHHTDAKVHMRYVGQTAAMRRIPDAAIPPVPSLEHDDSVPFHGQSTQSSANQGEACDSKKGLDNSALRQKPRQFGSFFSPSRPGVRGRRGKGARRQAARNSSRGGEARQLSRRAPPGGPRARAHSVLRCDHRGRVSWRRADSARSARRAGRQLSQRLEGVQQARTRKRAASRANPRLASVQQAAAAGRRAVALLRRGREAARDRPPGTAKRGGR